MLLNKSLIWHEWVCWVLGVSGYCVDYLLWCFYVEIFFYSTIIRSLFKVTYGDIKGRVGSKKWLKQWTIVHDDLTKFSMCRLQKKCPKSSLYSHIIKSKKRGGLRIICGSQLLFLWFSGCQLWTAMIKPSLALSIDQNSFI